MYIFKYKFVTVILLGTMSESFRKIVRIVFELRALMWGWQECGIGSANISLSIHQNLIKYHLIFSFKVFFYDG